MLRKLPGALGIFLIACATAVPAGSTEKPEVWTVAGKEVLRIRVTAYGKTPRERVELFDSRLTEIMSLVERPVTVADVQMTISGKTAAITVCGNLLVTVMPEDAEANKTSVEKLARIWLSNLRKTVPLLSPRVNPRGA